MIAAIDAGSAAEWVTAAITLIAVFVTAVLAIVAVWSDDIRAQLRRPDLHIYLANTNGEWTLLGNPPKFPAIYFHTVIENRTPSMIANHVELFIKTCRIIRKDGSLDKLPLPSPLPIKPRRDHGAIDIGAASYAYDTFRCLDAEKEIWILLKENRPNNFPCLIRGGESLEIEIQALAVNTVSNTLSITVTWDGIFPEEADGLGNHLTIKSTDFPAPVGSGIWEGLRHLGLNLARR